MTNQQIRNIIYTTIQPTLETKKNLSLITFSSEVEENVQILVGCIFFLASSSKTTILRKKLKKYTAN